MTLAYDATDVITSSNNNSSITVDASAATKAVNWNLATAPTAVGGVTFAATSTITAAEIKSVIGTQYADSITGAANTTINGGLGADTLIGADATTRLVYDATDALVKTGTVDASAQTAGISLFLDGNTQFQNILGVIGGAGNDNLRGSATTTLLNGGAGNDLIWGGANTTAMTLTGGAGNDQFWFGTGEGNKTITNDHDATGIAQSSGDTVNLYTVSAYDIVGLNKLTSNGIDGTINIGTQTLTMQNAAVGSDAARHFTSQEGWNFDIVFGSTVAGASVTGTAGVIDNLVAGTATGTIFDGKGGNDNLYGSNAADTFNYYKGDVIYSGGGADTITAAKSTTGVQLYLDSSVASAGTQATSWNVIGSTGNDELRGQTGVANQTLNGGSGNDLIWGGAGSTSNATLIGGAGNDTYYYGLDEGADVIQAGTVIGNGNAQDSVNFYNVTDVAKLSGTLASNDLKISVAGAQGVGTLTLQGWGAADGINKLTNVVVGGSNYTLSVDSATNKAVFTAVK